MNRYRGMFCSMWGSFEMTCEAESKEAAEKIMLEGLPEGTHMEATLIPSGDTHE